MPTAQAFLSLGILDYNLSDKDAAAADFRKAIVMDASMKQRFTTPPADNTKGGGRLRAILEDKEFVKKVVE